MPEIEPSAPPTRNATTTPVGAVCRSVRSPTRSGTTTGGLAEADSDIGTSASDTSTDTTAKSVKLLVSAMATMNWPVAMAPIVMTM